jgi:tetratricopeptide (TPR) repeat protein
MASLIPGYEYDIFISYRQKDNKGDRWVSEFVEALKAELESTFKEEISVYFDINPHNGLLETHDVYASLKEKMQCLVFIPIISRTYCDPKSFAWEHEFKTFVEQASQDQFGLKVKLPNGNVASRVLPIQIHDLKLEDKTLVEKELGGFIRAIEFIYKESGVNRPLKPDDDDKINLNRTKYRNQLNKVGNAIEEIISGLQTKPAEAGKETILQKVPSKEVNKEQKMDVQEKTVKSPKRKLLIGSMAALFFLVIVTLFAYPKIFKRDKLANLRSSDGRISIAVMPFENITNDTTWNYMQAVIQDNLINSLSNNPEDLKVRQRESIVSLIQGGGSDNYFSISPSVARTVSQKLDANVFIYGSITKAADKIRINARLIDSRTEDALKSLQIDGTAENIMPGIDTLSARIKDFLIISKLKKKAPLDVEYLASTSSPEAYRYFIYGNNAYVKRDWPTEVDMLSHALAIDSNFIWAAIMLGYAYSSQELYDQAKDVCLSLYKKRDQMPMQLKIWVNFQYSEYFETPNEAIKNIRQLLKIDDQMPNVYYNIGRNYILLYQYDKAIPELEKCLGIYDKWGIKPWWPPDYYRLGQAYHETGQYKKESELYKKAEQDFPDDRDIIYRQAILSLKEGDTVEADRYIKKYIFVCKDISYSEAVITTNLAAIYSEADILDKAERYYRQALVLEPEIISRLNNLAYYLIDKDRNINEGLELVDKTLEMSPDNYASLHAKGWGLYKQGKYKEALGILQRSWDLRMQNANYNHEAFLHLEAAKKAVAGQNNN